MIFKNKYKNHRAIVCSPSWIMLLYDVGISTQIPRRRKKEVFAAYEVIISCSAAFLGENSLCQLQLNMLCTSGVAAITYYAIYFPQITTVAHLLAGVLSHKHLLPLIYFLSRSLITTHCHQEWIWTDLSIFVKNYTYYSFCWDGPGVGVFHRWKDGSSLSFSLSEEGWMRRRWTRLFAGWPRAYWLAKFLNTTKY